MYWFIQKSGHDTVYVNYLVMYGFDKKGKEKGKNDAGSHALDREGVAVKLVKQSNGQWLPDGMVYAGHLESQPTEFLGSSEESSALTKWQNGRTLVKWDNIAKIGTHPVAFVARGSHAMKPASGVYKVINKAIGMETPIVLNEPAGDLSINAAKLGQLTEMDLNQYPALTYSGKLIDGLSLADSRNYPFIRYPTEQWVSLAGLEFNNCIQDKKGCQDYVYQHYQDVKIDHGMMSVPEGIGVGASFSLSQVGQNVVDFVKSVVWKVINSISETVAEVTQGIGEAFIHIFEKVGDVTVSATLQDDKEQEITTVSTTINVKPLVCSAGQIIENGKCVDIATLANGESNIALYGDVKKEMISTVKIDDGRTALLVDDVTAIYAAFGLDTRGKGLQDYVNTHINAVISMLKTNGATVNTLVNKPTRNAQGLAHNVVLDADFDSVVKSPADLRKLLLEYFNNKVLSTQLLNVVSTPSTKLRVTLSFWESNGNVFVWASVFPIDKSETVLQLYGDLNSTAAVTTAIKLQSQNNQQDFTQQAANLSGVDILWNVDNSGSMQEEQTNLANGAANFFSKLKATGIDYRLAVNTTDGRQCSLRKLTDGTNRFISSSTLNGENEWSILSRPGTNGSGTETAFYCVRELLEGVGSLAQDKAEFDRPNAKNLVVFVTDEPEIETYQNSKPTGSPSSYVARTFNDYKNFFVSSGATFFSIIEPNSTIVREDFTVSRPLVENCNGQGGSASGGAHFKEISKLTGGSSSSICADADSWSVMFDEVVRAATGLASNFKLSHVPIPSTIKVLVNGRSVLRDTNHAQGFDVVFSDSGAALAFYGNNIPIQNSIIQVEYRYLLN